MNLILAVVVLILAVPVGYLIAWLARDELVSGRKYFRILIIGSILAGIWFYLVKRIDLVLSMGFLLIISLISLVKSQDKKWTKVRR
tara:strand:+ start:6159 stop:6416 length:258 start_codon:yes stop_codon:yes gene_type:complete